VNDKLEAVEYRSNNDEASNVPVRFARLGHSNSLLFGRPRLFTPNGLVPRWSVLMSAPASRQVHAWTSLGAIASARL